MNGLTQNSTCWATSCLGMKGVRGFSWKKPSNVDAASKHARRCCFRMGHISKTKLARINALCVIASPTCAKSTSLQWCSVFLECLLYSKLSLEKQDNNCYHRSPFVIIFSCCYTLLYFWKLQSQIVWVLCFVDRASRYNRVKKTNLMHKLFFVNFVNLYMFREYLVTSSGGRWLSVVRWTTDSHLIRIINTKCCIHTVVPPDDGPRYARNM